MYFCLVCVLLCMVGLCSGDNLIRERVVYIDHDASRGNFLFRSSEPKIQVGGKDVFAYDLLVEYLRDAAANVSLKMPQNFTIVDIKLYYFNDPFEEPDVQLEKAYWKAHPSQGSFVGWHIYGDDTSPFIWPEKSRDGWARELRSWQDDDVPGKMTTLNSWLHGSGTNTAYVVHCECGCDRTGEISGSYVMRYLNVTLLDAQAWNDRIAGRYIVPFNLFAMEWYCLYLNLVEGFSIPTCSGKY